jgi:ribosomal protein S27E
MEPETIRVKTKCEGCGATHTIELFEGESVSGFIVACDKCNKRSTTPEGGFYDDE